MKQKWSVVPEQASQGARLCIMLNGGAAVLALLTTAAAAIIWLPLYLLGLTDETEEHEEHD